MRFDIGGIRRGGRSGGEISIVSPRLPRSPGSLRFLPGRKSDASLARVREEGGINMIMYRGREDTEACR